MGNMSSKNTINDESYQGLKATSGAAHVRNILTGEGVAGGQYDSDSTTSTTTNRTPIPAGAIMVWVCNESVATTESVRFIFGDATIVAIPNTGFRVSPGITTAAGDNGPKYLSVPVPSSATHMAYIAEAGTPTINVVWGF